MMFELMKSLKMLDLIEFKLRVLVGFPYFMSVHLAVNILAQTSLRIKKLIKICVESTRRIFNFINIHPVGNAQTPSSLRNLQVSSKVFEDWTIWKGANRES